MLSPGFKAWRRHVCPRRHPIMCKIQIGSWISWKKMGKVRAKAKPSFFRIIKPNQASVMPDDITPRCKWAGSGTQVQAAWRRPLAWPAAGASGGSGMRGRRWASALASGRIDCSFVALPVASSGGCASWPRGRTTRSTYVVPLSPVHGRLHFAHVHTYVRNWSPYIALQSYQLLPILNY